MSQIYTMLSLRMKRFPYNYLLFFLYLLINLSFKKVFNFYYENTTL